MAFPEEGFVWFALKDPATLPATLLWMSNGGRHYPPWNGRHVDTIGLEEVASYFAHGLAESARPNRLTLDGVATCHRLRPDRPLVVRYLMAVQAVPKNFGAVADIVPTNDGSAVTLVSKAGRRVTAEVDSRFLSGGVSAG